MAFAEHRPVTYIAAAAALGFFLSAGDPSAASELQDLRKAWRAADGITHYADVARRLILYRGEARYAKTAEVDYMIATSLCRVPETREAGVRHFGWILASYDLGPDRGKVEAERSGCNGQDARPIQVAFSMVPGQGGAAEIRSKLYYWIGREDAAVNTEPVEVVAPKTPEELKARLFDFEDSEAAVAAAEARLGPRFKVQATERFILASASGHSQAQLDRIADKLERFMSFFTAAFQMRPPAHLLTVYLVPSPADMQQLAEELHGIRVPQFSIGYAFRDDNSILAVIPGTAVGTLAHELFHVMVRDRYGDIPPWLEEGGAALYEVSNVSPKYLPGRTVDAGVQGPPLVGGELAVRGLRNWRGCVLRKLWVEGFGPEQVTRPKLRELVSMDWRAFNNLEGDELAAQQATIHAVARYFLLYLQEEDKLFELFSSFATRDPLAIEATPAEDAVERVRGILGDIENLDGRFESWLRETVTNQDCS